MKHDTINKVISEISATSFLEVGFQQGINFAQINCTNKLAVDPYPTTHHPQCIVMTSDDFFATNLNKFDVIFIDGLHTYEQVKIDFENSIKALNEGGVICLHDTSPKNEEYAKSFADGGQWNGDCYKLAIDLYSGIYKFKYYTVNEDHGVTVVFPGIVEDRQVKAVEYNYAWFDKNRMNVLNVR